MSLKATTLTVAVCLVISFIIQLSVFPYDLAARHPKIFVNLASTMLIHLPLILFFFALHRKQ